MGSEHFPSFQIGAWDMADGAFDGNGDAQNRSHDDDKKDGAFIQAKPQQGKRQPTNARKGLQSEDKRMQRIFGGFIFCKKKAQERSDHNGNEKADQESSDAHENRHRNGSVAESAQQRFPTAAGAGKSQTGQRWKTKSPSQIPRRMMANVRMRKVF